MKDYALEAQETFDFLQSVDMFFNFGPEEKQECLDYIRNKMKTAHAAGLAEGKNFGEIIQKVCPDCGDHKINRYTYCVTCNANGYILVRPLNKSGEERV